MKNKKVFVILGFIVFLVVIIVGLIFFFKSKEKYDYKIEKVTQVNYNIVNIDDRYGVIDRTGNIIVDPIYDIIQIPNPSKDIFICLYDYNTETREYSTKVLNSKQEEIYKEYSNIQAIPTETTYDGIPFEKTILKYKKDGKYGLLNINGKELTGAIYDQISAIAYKEGMVLVKQGNFCGVINLNGIEVIPVEYESITADNYYNEETLYKTTGFIVSKKSEEGYRYGYINYKGDVILNTEYTELERVTEIQDDKNVYFVALKDGQAGLLKNKKVILNYEYEDISYNLYNNVFIIQRNGKQGIADIKGKIKIQTEYDNILVGGIYINAKKDDELLILDLNGNKIENEEIISKTPTKDGKHFIVSNKSEIHKITDKDGNVIIDKNYSYIEEVGENFFIVTNNGKNGIIDLSGKAVVDLKYNSIFELDGTDILEAVIVDNNTICLINKEMNILATMDNAGMEIKDSYIHLYSEKEDKYFSKNGKKLSSKEAFPNNKMYAKEIDGKWGFVDNNGNLKIQNEYEKVTEFNEYGFAGIKKDGKWGSINENGEIVQEPVYSISWQNPSFIGKYYKSEEWYGELFYINKVNVEEND